MPRVGRVRLDAAEKVPNGSLHESYYGFTDWKINSSGWSPKHYNLCSDYSGKPFIDSPLDIKKRTCDNRTIRTQRWPNWEPHNVKWKIPPETPTPLPNFSKMEKSINPNWEDLASKALANANPNTEAVDLPLFFYELKDLPRMLSDFYTLITRYYKTRGNLRNAIVEGASDYLGFQFGWKPFIADIYDMILMVEEQEKLLRYLRQLDGGTTVQRSLGKTKGTGIVFETTNHYACPGIRGRDNYLRTEMSIPFDWEADAWYTMRLELIDPLIEGPGLDADIRSILYGTNANLETIWNAIPWSWLIDWFTNIGTLLNATRGVIRYRHSDLNIMWHYNATCQIKYHEYSKAAGSIVYDGPNRSFYSVERKLRDVRPTPYALPTFTVPAFSNYQTSIIGALGILQGRKTIVN